MLAHRKKKGYRSHHFIKEKRYIKDRRASRVLHPAPSPTIETRHSSQSSIMEDDATAHPGPPANTPKLSSSKTKGRDMKAKKALPAPNIVTRAYQQEMLEMSLANNIIIALDTGSGKTHIAILRIKHELEREKIKVRRSRSLFVGPLEDLQRCV